MNNNIDKIKAAFISGEIDLISAIDKIQDNAYSAKEAEKMVYEWKDNIKYETGNKRYPREEDDENNEEGA